MSYYTLEERRDRLDEMKRQEFRRCSLERLGATMEAGVDAEIVERYLRDYVAPGDEKTPCPSCGVGFFGWGLVHGQGNCSCGWPGTLYHRIYDLREDGDLVCEREGCGKRRDEHVLLEDETLPDELRCPELDGAFKVYSPPLVVSFNRLLWAHPYSVHLRRVG